MRTRRFAVLSLVVLTVAGCGGTASKPPSDVLTPSPTPTQTISGVVSAGVEPHCLVLDDSTGSHLLFFENASLKASAPAGATVTLVGYAAPRQMTTCQQGVPFIVTSVRKG